MENKTKGAQFSQLFYNRVTYLGVFLSLLVFVIEFFLFGLDFIAKGHNVYLGIFTYVLLPPFLILGLLLIPLGAYRKRKRILKGLDLPQPKSIYIDPTIPAHRNAIFVFVIGTSLLVIMTVIGSYKAFHYTESVHFCGLLCHQVMHPQYTVYAQSSHARVKCVDCHIGAGADWYVRSKLSGLRQVYKTMSGTYPKPIPNPIHNLRPAAETCEQCHWPEKFYGSFELQRKYFPASETEYPSWYIRMLVHVGGNRGQGGAIHSHMYIDNKIYYAAEDEKRQKIPWIKSVDGQGKETVYTSDDSLFKDKEPSPELIRKMDCMDCHNRPAHRFQPPYELINEQLLSGKINPRIPLIKQKAMEVLSGDYASQEEGEAEIRQKLTKFYQEKHKDFYASARSDVEKAIEEIVNLYHENFFPEMKTRWDIYPENIGHLTSPGCFRCHDGGHKSQEGKVISRDCKICHTIIEQGPPGAVAKSTDGLEFTHPFDETNDLWKEMNCFDCHTGN